MPVKCTCHYCGNTFYRPPSGANPKSGRVYCSRACMYACPDHRATLSKRTTDAWNNPETRKVFMDGIERRSDDPNWYNAPHFKRGGVHPRYNGGRKKRNIAMSRHKYKHWRKCVFQRDNYTCQHCGQRGGDLIAHHLEHWADNPDLRYAVDNGLTLCEQCHDVVHGLRRRKKTRYCIECGSPKKSLEGALCRSCANKHSYPDSKRVKPTECPICKRQFMPRDPKTKYCSRACQSAAAKKAIAVTCNNCGKTIYKRPCEIKPQNYCSQACYHKSRTRSG